MPHVTAEPTTEPSARSTGALANRDYRIFAAGQFVSNLGTWTQDTALKWLVFAVLTRDTWQLGVVGFLQQIPVLLLGLWAGVIADRVDRRRLLMATQAVLLVQSTVLAVLTLWPDGDGISIVRLWHLYALAALAGTAQAFDMPVRQAILPSLVPRADLHNAVALNSLSFNAARILGPATAGIVIARAGSWFPGRVGFGEGICFAANAVSFFAVLLSLAWIRPSPSPQATTTGALTDAAAGHFARLTEGFRYVLNRPHLGAILAFVAIAATFALPYLMLVPVYATVVLHGDSRTQGWLTSAIGAGALAGGAAMASQRNTRGLAMVIATATALFAVSISLLALLPAGLPRACILLAWSGFCMVIAMIGCQTLMQSLVADPVRGRVMSLYSMVNVGCMPFGGLLTGGLARVVPVQNVMLLNSAAVLLTVAVFWRRLPRLRASARATEEFQSFPAS